jgi:hypothetical protein
MVTDRILAIANSEVIQAFVPPTDASPLSMRTFPVDIPHTASTMITKRIQVSGRFACIARSVLKTRKSLRKLIAPPLREPRRA